jgi:hypothetical protein
MVEAMSALYVEICPQPASPLSRVIRTSAILGLEKVSMRVIFLPGGIT